MIPTALARHMAETVTHEPCTGKDSYDAGVYGAAKAYRCRIVRETKPVVTKEGKEARSQTQVYLDRRVTVTVRDRITLPDGSQPSIIGVVEHARSPVGSDLGYTEVQL